MIENNLQNIQKGDIILKKFLKSTSYALAVIFTLSLIVVGTTASGLFGVQTVSAAPKADVVTAASLVDNVIGFEKSIGKRR